MSWMDHCKKVTQKLLEVEGEDGSIELVKNGGRIYHLKECIRGSVSDVLKHHYRFN